jgi:hypothetical protein
MLSREELFYCSRLKRYIIVLYVVCIKRFKTNRHPSCIKVCGATPQPTAFHHHYSNVDYPIPTPIATQPKLQNNTTTCTGAFLQFFSYYSQRSVVCRAGCPPGTVHDWSRSRSPLVFILRAGSHSVFICWFPVEDPIWLDPLL